jgi:hypothetical protein
MTADPSSSVARAGGAIEHFYITNVFWGPAYVKYFTDFCLPSLLWPLNLTARGTKKNVLLIVTSGEDWEQLNRTPIFAEAQRHYEIDYMELPSAEEMPNKFVRCAAGYRMATEKLAKSSCVALHLSPDLLIPDGLLPELFRRHAAGAAIVVMPAWRTEQEGMVAALAAAGHISGPVMTVERPIGARDLVRACAQSLHYFERDRYWDGELFREDANSLCWKVPGDGGWLMHAPMGVPFMDYARIGDHDVSGLRELPFDSYPAMFRATGGYVEGADDSDLLFIGSFTPAHENLPVPETRWQCKAPVVGHFMRGLVFRHYVRRMLARHEISLRVLSQPYRVHTGELNEAWRRVTEQADLVIGRYIGDLLPVDVRPAGASSKASGIFLTLATFLLLPSLAFPLLRLQAKSYGGVILRALSGDKDARLKILRRLSLRKRHGSLRDGGA